MDSSGSEYLAHIAEDGRTQSVTDHLTGTSKLCRQFADSFGMGKEAEFIGLAHDFGKCCPEFQRRLQGGPIVDHATAGAIECARQNAAWAAACVAGHHSGLADFGNINVDAAGDPTLWGRLKAGLAGGIPNSTKPLQLPAMSKPRLWNKDGFTDSFLVRMLYSCLTDADFLDTEAFMQGGKTNRGGYDTLEEMQQRLADYVAGWGEPKSELNRIRETVRQECLTASENDPGLFSLTVPTGGGKTISSVAFALRHAVRNKMSRIIYVIPYISIIEQNAAIFKKVFGENNVIEHHSNVGAGTGSNPDVLYRQALASENWDAPIVITTAVQFFESMYANSPSKCRKLHNIANSVVIFDEAQMIPLEHMRPCVGAMAELVQHYNSSMVLCMATQPVVDDIVKEFAPHLEAKEICSQAEYYFEKLKRVSFATAGTLDVTALVEKLSESSQCLCIVNNRKTAQRIYEQLPEEGRYHLSTLMCPYDRSETLQNVKVRLKTGQPCRLISTPLIEAGVDIDFPTVYRELAGLDSILQAAGRCNREGKRKPEDSIVTVFSGDWNVPLSLRINVAATRETVAATGNYDDIATVDRYFRTLKSMSDGKRDRYDVVQAFRKGISGGALPFKTVADTFSIIDSNTKTVYLPRNEESKALCDLLLSGCAERSVFRRLARYSVNIYDNHYQQLLSAAVIRETGDDSAVLSDTSLYSEQTGLALQVTQSDGWFI